MIKKKKKNQQLELYNSHWCGLFSAHERCLVDSEDIVNVWITCLKYVIIPQKLHDEEERTEPSVCGSEGAKITKRVKTWAHVFGIRWLPHLEFSCSKALFITRKDVNFEVFKGFRRRFLFFLFLKLTFTISLFLLEVWFLPMSACDLKRERFSVGVLIMALVRCWSPLRETAGNVLFRTFLFFFFSSELLGNEIEDLEAFWDQVINYHSEKFYCVFLGFLVSSGRKESVALSSSMYWSFLAAGERQQ